MTRTIPCMRCGTDIRRKRLGRTPRNCEPCRAEIATERSAQRMRDKRALRREMVADLDHWREIHEYDTGSIDYLLPRIDEFVDLLADGDDRLPFVPDRQPDGTYSPRGSDDGCSTGFKDLAEWLDNRAREVADHPWFEHHPHFAYEPEEAVRAA